MKSELRSTCWDKALSAYGTHYIFQRRAKNLKQRIDVLNYIGVVVPLLVGGLVISFGRFELLGVAIVIAGVVGLAQISVNLWSLIKNWSDEYAYAVASAAANESLAVKYSSLAGNPPGLIADFRREFDRILVDDEARRARDIEKHLTEKELRRGMCAGLRQYQRACSSCGLVPSSVRTTSCGVCGQF
ncbi:mobilome CxxCx(11)CxxC protein [Streptomyces phaeochromogenes]|uniref:mobilome CxxCx(11)CxxC protein n=1 Tax=Streptomyces phaeochromogenes TaxID=1923 RepID=UPI003867D269|nr:hypothetical protein OG277_23770 [Streptomyces phaeochromogenes]